MYKLVASDMDDTFLGRDHLPIPANIDALRRMRELGILFVPASGRPYPSVMSSLKGIEDVLEGSYVISLNGEFINRFGDPDPIFESQMDRASVEYLWERGREMGLCMHIYTASGKFIVANLTDAERAWLSGLDEVTDLGDAPANLSFADDDPFTKILYMSDDFASLQKLGAEMAANELDPEKVAVTYSSNRYVEFMPAGINKGTGLTKLTEILGMDLAETVGVGDAANDADMIRAAGLGVGVANSSPDLVPYCDVILETDAYHGAFPELLERYLEPSIES